MELRPVNPGDRCGNACSLKAFHTTARRYKASISAPKHMLCGSSMSKGRKPSSMLLSAEMGNPSPNPSSYTQKAVTSTRHGSPGAGGGVWTRGGGQLQDFFRTRPVRKLGSLWSFATKPDDPSSSTWWKERTYFQKLSSDCHVCTRSFP